MKILVTGAAGFIGSHLSHSLSARGIEVIGVDNLNTYYSTRLKLDRLADLGVPETDLDSPGGAISTRYPTLRMYRGNLADRAFVESLFAAHPFTHVCHLAAQAGVRYSLEAPLSYIDSNITAFAHILEGCRHWEVDHLVFASSSSVYGLNGHIPYSTSDNVDHPVSLYAATKKSNELMAHTYAHLYRIPCTGLRFFTVYGPWGRPDMAYYHFSRAILEGTPIQVFNEGNMRRDFTYIDDIVEGIMRILESPARPNPNWDASRPDPATSPAPYRLYNLGNDQPVALLDFIGILENELGRKANTIMMPMQPGDVAQTWADVSDLKRDIGFQPSTPLSEGIRAFVKWYKTYHRP